MSQHISVFSIKIKFRSCNIGNQHIWMPQFWQNLNRTPGISQQLHCRIILIPEEMLLKRDLKEHKHLPNIIYKARTAHLAGCNCFTKNLNQHKNKSISQLSQPPRTLFYRTPTTDCFHLLLVLLPNICHLRKYPEKIIAKCKQKVNCVNNT